MQRYLIDANLPRNFRIWNGDAYVHQHDIDPTLPDRDIWHFARERDLIIVTKDSDFSSRMLLSEPPPRVVHIRLGNMSMRVFHEAIVQRWAAITTMITDHKLVTVWTDRMEGVK